MIIPFFGRTILPGTANAIESGTEDGRGGEIRTHDPLYPKQVRYQTAPRPEPIHI